MTTKPEIRCTGSPGEESAAPKQTALLSRFCWESLRGGGVIVTSTGAITCIKTDQETVTEVTKIKADVRTTSIEEASAPHSRMFDHVTPLATRVCLSFECACALSLLPRPDNSCETRHTCQQRRLFSRSAKLRFLSPFSCPNCPYGRDPTTPINISTSASEYSFATICSEVSLPRKKWPKFTPAKCLSFHRFAHSPSRIIFESNIIIIISGSARSSVHSPLSVPSWLDSFVN